MAMISKGILGPISGTVGTVVGATWKGIAYLRSKSTSRRKNFSQAQLEQQAKFLLILRFLQTMTPLLDVTFRKYSNSKTGFNSAMSYNLKNAITGALPNYAINYPAVLVARGDLPNGGSPTAALAGQVINFSWTDNSGSGKAKPMDTPILVVYCPARQQSITANGQSRGDGGSGISVAQFAGEVVHTYLSFAGPGFNDIANSVYTGQFTVTA